MPHENSSDESFETDSVCEEYEQVCDKIKLWQPSKVYAPKQSLLIYGEMPRITELSSKSSMSPMADFRSSHSLLSKNFANRDYVAAFEACKSKSKD